jgi:hypothetical protein
LYKMSKGEADGWDLAFALLDCVPLAGALGTAAKAARGAGEVAKGLSAGEKALGTGSQVARGATEAVSTGTRVRRSLSSVPDSLAARVRANQAVLRRPKLRVATQRKIIQDAPRFKNGDFRSVTDSGRRIPCARDADGVPVRIDPQTGKPSADGMTVPEKGNFHYGHKPGHEWSETRIRATEENWTRRQVIEHENVPDHFRVEHPDANLSHRFEATVGSAASDIGATGAAATGASGTLASP